MKHIFLILFCLITLSARTAANIEEGKAIFKTRCVSCHAIDKVLVGPALKDIDKRRDLAWFSKFVSSSATMIASGDETANKVFNEFNKIPMPDHKDMNAEQLASVYEYIKAESANLASTPAVNAIPRLENKKGTQKPFTQDEYWFLYLWSALTLLLIWVLYFRVSVNDMKEKDIH